MTQFHESHQYPHPHGRGWARRHLAGFLLLILGSALVTGVATAVALTAAQRLDQPAGQGIAATGTATTSVASDRAEVGELIDRAVAAGANSVQRVEFAVTGRSKARQATLAKAVADARRQAERMDVAKAPGAAAPLRSRGERPPPARSIHPAGEWNTQEGDEEAVRWA